MAILSNINGKFAIDSTGAVQFSGAAGASGYVLKSNGAGSAPTWVDGSTVIGGPYLPLSGGTLTGATATASGISFTVGGVLTGTSATFTSTISAVGASTFTLNDGIFIKAVNGTNNVAATNVWGYGLYEGASKLGEISLVRDGTSSQMYIGTTGANQVLRIGSANKVTALTIDASQNATFAGQVHVDSKPNSGLAYNVLIDVGSAGDGTIGYQTVDQLAANLSVSSSSNWVKSSNDIYNTNSGNVGIGTTLPAYKLEVAGTIGTQDRLAIQQTYFGYSSSYKVVQYGETGSTKAISLGYNPSSNTNGGFGGNEILIPNNIRILAPNAADNQFYGVMMFNSSDKLLIGSSNYLIDSNFIMCLDPATKNVGIGRSPVAYGSFTVLDLAGSSGAIQKLIHTGSTVELQSYASSTVGAVGTATNHPLLFTTNDTEKMRITSAGDINILNATATDSKSIGITNAAGTTGWTFGNGVLSNTHQFVIYDNTAGSPRMLIDSSGKVGIGTTSPTNQMHIHTDNDNTYALRVEGSTNNGAGVWTGIGIAGESTNTKSAIIFEDIGVSYARGKLLFCVNNEQNQNSASPSDAKMTISNDGKLGIGTTSPAEKLTIDGTVSGAYVRISNAASGDVSSGYMIYNGSNLDFNVYTNPTFGNTTLLTREALAIRAGGSERMRITSGGNVGIGYTNPGSKLSVNGDGGFVSNSSSRVLYLTQQSAGNGNIIQFLDQSGNNVWELVGRNTNFYIYNNQNSVGYVFESNASNGYVAILKGGTDASYPLDVTGSIRSTADVIAYSDRRVKENIKTIDNALDKVTKLRGVSYNRKDIEDKSTKIGVIAQEVKDILPEVVDQDGDDKYSVAYGNMAGLFIEAIKELEARVKELENK